MRIMEQQLSEPQRTRLEDALRLNETKMDNIEENLNRARSQKERLKRYHEILLELKEQKEHLYDINKQQASNIQEKDLLQRFEAFEGVMGQYQRLTVLEQLRREQKLRLSTLTRDVSEATKKTEEEEKRLNTCLDVLNESRRRMELALDAFSEAQILEGKKAFTEIVLGRVKNHLNDVKNRLSTLERETNDTQLELDHFQGQFETLKTRRQSIELHSTMVEHSELLIERLTKLAELESEVAKTDSLQKECQRRQADENALLERVYASFQQVTQDIDTTKDKLAAHREQNFGLNSFQLQERAMQKHLRRAMLQSAQSLWVRIAQGYEMIEEHLQNINTMRLKQEDLSKKISELEKELGVLRVTSKDKEYTFTLSKSQNVILLRSDLKEGTSCTVCGATHHPYHSDTMLEQNKLISEIKTEAEQLANELKQKENLLREMQLEHAAVQAKRMEAEDTLIVLRSLQNRYVQDWQMFANLDPTFQKCDSSTNAAARTAILRQLIENIEEEVEKAKKELETFNFHQQCINELTEQLAKEEQRKAEIVTRLNEINTGCQVMAVKLERASTMKQLATDRYEELSEVIDKMITIHDWRTTWKKSHESLIMRIQELTKQWFGLLEEIQHNEQDRRCLEIKLDQMKKEVAQAMTNENELVDALQHYQNLNSEAEKQVVHLVGTESPKTMLQKVIEANNQSISEYRTQLQKARDAALMQKEMAGRQTENIEAGNLTDERTAAERQNVDLWMRQYNANHPPVHYNELEEIFKEDKDWNSIREHVRSIEIDSILTQQRVDKLRSRLVALQAEGNITDTNSDILQVQLNSQIETLESRKRETVITVGQLTYQLKMHHSSVEYTRNELMKE